MKKYKFILESSIISEITWDQYNKIKDYMSAKTRPKDLPLNDIFKDKTRIMIPFKSTAKNEIQEFVDFFEQNGYKLDFSTGLAEREIEIPDGPRKGEKKLKKEKIGGILKKAHDLARDIAKGSGEQPELERKAGMFKKMFPSVKTSFGFNNVLPYFEKFVDFWNKKSEFYRKNPNAAKEGEEKPKYSIIISRNPVDVLRMSDYANIKSCHSPGGDYWKCAVAEAKGNGLVAYIVENEDLPEKFDLDKDEIFSDAKRDVSGIVPISRIRLRLYKDPKYKEVAVPELRVYGKTIPGFKEEVKKWAQENQKDKIDSWKEKKDSLNIKDFTRYGGSYGDNADGELLNNLIGKEVFSGYAESDRNYEDEEDQSEEIAEQYQEQCENFKRIANGRMNNCTVDFSVDNGDEIPYVFFSGLFTIKFDLSDLKKDVTEDDLNGIKINEYLENKGIYFNEAEITKLYHEFVLEGKIWDNNGNYNADPDGFDSFCDMVETEYDDKSDDIKDIIFSAFVENNFAVEKEFNKKYKLLQDEEEAKKQFKNLEVNAEDNDIQFSIPNNDPIIVEVPYELGENKISSFLYNDNFKEIVLDGIYDDYDKNESIISKQLKLPFKEAINRKNLPSKKDFRIKVLKADEDKHTANLDFNFSTDNKDSNEKLNDIIKFAVYLDKRIENGGLQKIFQFSVNEFARQQDYVIGKELKLQLDLTKELEQKIKDTPFQQDRILDRNVTHPQISYNYLNQETELRINYINTSVWSVIINNYQYEDQVKFLVECWYPALFKEIKHKFARTKIISLVLSPDISHFKSSLVTESLEKYLKDNKFKELKNGKGQYSIYSLEMASIKENKKMFKNEIKDIDLYVENLVKLKELNGIVNKLDPLDIMKLVAKELDICPKDAAKITIGLIKKVSESCYVPADDRPDTVFFKSFSKVRDNKKIKKYKFVDENPSMPMGKDDMTPRFNLKRSDFPPDPRNEPRNLAL